MQCLGTTASNTWVKSEGKQDSRRPVGSIMTFNLWCASIPNTLQCPWSPREVFKDELKLNPTQTMWPAPFALTAISHVTTRLLSAGFIHLICCCWCSITDLLFGNCSFKVSKIFLFLNDLISVFVFVVVVAVVFSVAWILFKPAGRLQTCSLWIASESPARGPGGGSIPSVVTFKASYW